MWKQINVIRNTNRKNDFYMRLIIYKSHFKICFHGKADFNENLTWVTPCQLVIAKLFKCSYVELIVLTITELIIILSIYHRLKHLCQCRWQMVAAGFSHCVPTPTGQQCQDSMECRDHCCREVRGFRSRYYVCGTPADDALAYTCIKAARSENDVLDYLV